MKTQTKAKAISTVQAQIGDAGGDPDVPIDGGLSLLVAAGVGYGAKKLKEKRKK
ncbi:MAG: PID-CTERM protein-sorting domain-containing protein [Chitinophagaceae bacterium]